MSWGREVKIGNVQNLDFKGFLKLTTYESTELISADLYELNLNYHL